MKTGKIITDKEIPMIEILTNDGNLVGYLAPFRGYRFQVMGDQNGRWDYGSGPVIGLGNILMAFHTYQQPKDTAKCATSLFSTGSDYNNGEAACAVMQSLAMEAIYKSMSYPGKGDGSLTMELNSQWELSKFIRIVYNFLAEQLEIPTIEIK